jgi:hypothetical protein
MKKKKKVNKKRDGFIFIFFQDKKKPPGSDEGFLVFKNYIKLTFLLKTLNL